MQKLAEWAAQSTAQEIRDRALADVTSFRGAAEQLDDLTLVVVKPR
jgi:serine phosphatase RsbU (regulator of sigma subunit)